jgi:hypothetical protein
MKHAAIGLCSTSEQRIVGAEYARFLGQHHRYAVADGICQPVGTAYQFHRIAAARGPQWTFAYRADQ